MRLKTFLRRYLCLRPSFSEAGHLLVALTSVCTLNPAWRQLRIFCTSVRFIPAKDSSGFSNNVIKILPASKGD